MISLQLIHWNTSRLMWVGSTTNMYCACLAERPFLHLSVYQSGSHTCMCQYPLSSFPPLFHVPLSFLPFLLVFHNSSSLSFPSSMLRPLSAPSHSCFITLPPSPLPLYNVLLPFSPCSLFFPPGCYEQGGPHISDNARHSGTACTSPFADGETYCLQSKWWGISHKLYDLYIHDLRNLQKAWISHSTP